MTTDLIAKSFNIVQTSVNAGNDINIFFNWENSTANVLENLEIDFYLSRDSEISTDDAKIGTYTLDTIASNSETATQTTLQLPEDEADFWRLAGNGAYHVGMLVRDETITELDFAQQYINRDTLNVSISSIIDLTGNSFNITNIDSETVDIDFTIANQEAGDANNFTVDFYLSNDEEISHEDYYLGSYEIADLTGNSNSDDLSASFNLPEDNDPFWLSQGAGIYYAGMIVNQSGTVTEVADSNNNSNQGEFVDYQGVIIEKPPFPDLRGLGFDVIQDASFEPEQSVEIDFTITNTSLEAVSGDFNVSFYLSSDEAISTTDTFLSSYTVTDSLAARDLAENTVTLTLPDRDDPLWTIDTASYYVGMVIDPDNEIIEIDESNNSSLEQLIDYDSEGTSLDNLRANVPDLTMSYFDVVTNSAEIGATIDLELGVTNLSGGSAEPFTVSFYISDNQYISNNDFKLGSYELTEGLASGISTTELITQSLTLPDLTAEFWRAPGNGTYYIGAIIDSENQVAEFDESNNSNSGYKLDYDAVAIDNIALSDLVAEEFTITQENPSQPGNTIDFDFEILNQTAVAAGTFNVEFYISDNEYISQSDTLLGSYEIANLEGNSSTGLLDTTVFLPDAEDDFWGEVDGAYYVGMLIDGDNEVAEFTQLNNNNQGQYIDYDAINILSSANQTATDLRGVNFNVVAEATEDSPLLAGDNFSVTYEVSNQGAGTVEFSATGFFLFTEDYLNNHQQIDLDDVADSNSGLYFLFGDRNSSFVELDPSSTTGELTTELKIPESLTAGYYYVGILNDQFDEVAESNELNNSLVGESIDYQSIYIDVV